MTHPPESYSDRSLVRFRAMVQDTSHSAEMYLSKYSNGSLGGWGIEPEHADDQDDENLEYDNLRECTVLWAVNVPGESAWAVSELEGPEFRRSISCRDLDRSSRAIVSSPSQASHQPSRPHKSPLPDQPHIGVKIKVNKSYCGSQHLMIS